MITLQNLFFFFSLEGSATLFPRRFYVKYIGIVGKLQTRIFCLNLKNWLKYFQNFVESKCYIAPIVQRDIRSFFFYLANTVVIVFFIFLTLCFCDLVVKKDLFFLCQASHSLCFPLYQFWWMLFLGIRLLVYHKTKTSFSDITEDSTKS